MAQVQFRDGPRDLPEHLADLMVGLDTYRLTYDEAIKKMNDRLMSDYLNKTLQKVISEDLFGKKVY
jgi:hypothetical protein